MLWSWVERGIVQDGGGVLYSVGTTFQIGGARRSGLEILMPNHEEEIMEKPLENAVDLKCGRVAFLFSKLLWVMRSCPAFSSVVVCAIFIGVRSYT